VVISFGETMNFIISLIIAGCAFLLGWMSCSGTDFLKSRKITATVMSMSYVFYLTVINKGLEYLHYAHVNRLEALRKNGKSYGHEEYEKLKKDFDNTIQSYKDNTITYLLQAHPELFKQFLEFDDWRGSQRFLNNNKITAIMFSKETNK
tara:strand:+ start:4904 stop:5350 length:447 start_codon:yes stop_codon:yes gene_type:complete